ncbi:MAG: hypothetical protein ACRDRG_00755 [Pseudonocardiaceae bacterium]
MSSYRHVGPTVMLLLAVVLASCGGGAPGEEDGTVEPSPVPDFTALECGQPFSSPGARGLTLTGRFPTTVPAGADKLAGTVEVTSQEPIKGVASRPFMFLVRDGRIVALLGAHDLAGFLVDLGPGKEAASLPGVLVLASCDGTGGVRPGTYELYARVGFNRHDAAGMEGFGGPWPLEVT